MSRNAILGICTLIVLAVSSSLASASYYGDYGNSYSYVAPSVQTTYPSYTYSPTVSSQTGGANSASNFYMNNYQGPYYQSVTTFDQTLDKKTSGRIILKTSEKQTQTYMGAYQYTNYGAQQASQYMTNYNSYSPNPTSYNGGSYWRGAAAYDAGNYGSNSYTNPYYYSPRYDSHGGYYNWRY